MKITKFGHCCLLIEEAGVRILTDPGTYSTTQNETKDLDIILITHEHPDHLHTESLKLVVAHNPEALIVTNTAVGQILTAEGIPFQILEHGGVATLKELVFEGFGKLHEIIYSDWPQVQNTGYFIANKLFYPGDAFTDPQRPIDVLALPVAGPWLKISEAVEYAKALKPKRAFPVHDGILKTPGMVHRLPSKALPEVGIEFIALNEGNTHEF